MPDDLEAIALVRWKCGIIRRDHAARARLQAASGQTVNQINRLLDSQTMPHNALVSAAYRKQLDIELAAVQIPPDMKAG